MYQNTPAMDVLRSAEALLGGLPRRRVASRLGWWLGRAPNTVRRWLIQGRRDLGEEVAGEGKVPPPDVVQALRLLVVVKRAAPGMLSELRHRSFWLELERLRGDRLLLDGEQRGGGVVVDGADL